MNFEEFEESVAKAESPAGISAELKALWYDKQGDWNRAHAIVQGISSQDASWVHAYLHRKEGDLANAAYWYGRAGRELSASGLATEWKSIVGALLMK